MNRYFSVACAVMLFLCWVATAHAGAENKCKACHDFTTGKNRIGPSLKGVLGRKAGTYPGYRYVFTTYIKGEPWVWDEEKIRKWDNDAPAAIKEFTGNPNATTRMPALHMTGVPEDRIIDYIRATSAKGAGEKGAASGK